MTAEAPLESDFDQIEKRLRERGIAFLYWVGSVAAGLLAAALGWWIAIQWIAMQTG